MNLLGARVLIVEDDPFVAMAAQEMVEGLAEWLPGSHALSPPQKKEFVNRDSIA
jgi:hypothetical protein